MPSPYASGMFSKLCPVCGIVFQARRKDQTACNKRCGDANRQRIRRGTSARYTPSGKRKFYSRHCAWCESLFTTKVYKQRFCTKQCCGSFTHNAVGYAYSVKSRSKLVPYLRGTLWYTSRSHGNRAKLSVEYLLSLWESQQGKCALSDVPMTTIKGQGRVATNVSIDRIDPKNGYVEGNVRLVCRIVNVMRHDLTDEALREWCAKILGIGRGNGSKNLRVLSKSKNRGYKRNSRGKPIFR